MTELYFGFSLGLWISALIFATIATFLSYRITNPPLTKFPKTALIALRWIAFLMLFLMIVEPLLVRIVPRDVEPEVVILWDDSESMSLSDRQGDRKAIVAEIDESQAMRTIRA
ncbi:MAG TPA: hypothetical protein ENN07_03915, partial [candidate division Zixibacteria bacterium]|nr:hypothetical protein [candidate division Zixibacteria bacterium]